MSKAKQKKRPGLAWNPPFAAALHDNTASKGLKAKREVPAFVNSTCRRFVDLLFFVVSLANTNRKRPSKPYGCTFLTCNKLSCSKKDWKRHETLNILISKLGTAMQRKLAVPVPRCVTRRKTFHEHLEKGHDISEPEVLNTTSDACRIGRNCQTRLWCGFCNRLVDLKNRGVDAWTERFDHMTTSWDCTGGQNKASEIGFPWTVISQKETLILTP